VIFQKMQVVVQKNVGETIPQLRHVSQQESNGQPDGNPGA
jgi:hypothetical protein